MEILYFFYNRALIANMILCILFLIIRHMVKKKSNIAVNILWIILLFRLLFPVPIYTNWGMIPEIKTVSTLEIDEINNQTETNQKKFSDMGSNLEKIDSKSFIKDNRSNAIHIWYFGLFCFFAYYCVSLFFLKKRQKRARKINGYEGVYEWMGQYNACVIGLFKPRIYIPRNLSESERKVVLLHEKMHIRRGDNILLFLYYVALCLNWFNPCCWFVYYCILKDVELACDECVLRKSSISEKQIYSKTLIHLCNMFSESNYPIVYISRKNKFIKERINNIGKKKNTSKLYYLIVGIVSVFILFFGIIFFSHPNISAISNKEQIHEISEKKFDAQLPRISFAGTTRLVVYDNYGVYVFNLERKKLIKYIDFNKIKMNGLEGDNATFVSVSRDMEYIQIYNVRGDSYIFDSKKDFDIIENADESNIEWIDTSLESTNDYIDTADYYSIGEVINIDGSHLGYLAIKKAAELNYSSLVYVVKDKNLGSDNIIPLFE